MLEDVKKLLGFNDEDEARDARLTTIIAIVTSRLLLLLGKETVPDGLKYIVTEVTVSRFNRIGSEGLSGHSVEGESLSWSDDDFAPYKADIEAYLVAQDTPVKGRVRFI